MALGTPTSLGTTAQASASASTQAHTTTGAAPADSTVVVCLGHSSAGNPLTPTVTDDQGGTYTVALLLHGGTSMTTAIAYRHCPGGLVSGAVVTASWGATQTAARFTHVSYMTGNGKPERTASNDRSGSAFNTYICGVTAATLTAGQAIGVMNSANGVTPNNTTGSSPAATVHAATSVSSKGFGVIRSAPGAGVTVTQTGQVIPLVTSATLGVLVHFVSVPAQAIETDTAGAISVYKHGIGQAVETDTARKIFTPGTLRGTINADSPSSWWPLDELAGTVAADSIGSNPGTIIGSPGLGHPTIPVDPGGYGIRLDALDDVVSLPGPTMPGTGSAELWFEWSAGTSILRDSTSLGGWIIGFDNSGTFGVRLGGNTRNSTLTTDAVRDGRPHHLVVTWAPASSPKIYLDGVDVTSTTGNVSPTGGVMPWVLGLNGTAPAGERVRGRVQHLAFYSTALSGARVTAHYAFATPAPATPTTYDQAVTNKRPLGVWKLDETAGTVAADSAGVGTGGNPGTYVGGPTLAQLPLVNDGGTSVSFDGVNDEIDMEGVPAIVGSWEMWFRWTAGVALGRDNGAGFIPGFDNAGTFTVRIGTDRGTTKTTAQVRDGSIHHLVVAWNDTSAKVYLDGVDITGIAWNPSVVTGAIFTIMRNQGNAQWATGRVDRMASYPYMLSAADAAENFTLGRTWPVNRASETDTAGALTARKTQTLGRASDTETAGAVTRAVAGNQTISVGQASETDAAGSVRTHVAVAQASELDTAGAIAAAHRLTLAQASETDTAGAVTARTVRLVNRASETDTARRLSTIVKRATETDTARAIGRNLVSPASETDMAGTIRDVVVLGRASETDTARPITAIWFPLVDQAQETDTAGTVARLLINRADETDSAGAWARLLVNQALETDTAQTALPTLTLHPEFIELDPALDSQVFDPTLIRNQNLEPEPFAPPAATVFGPALDAGQPLEPDTLTGALSPTVYDPTLIAGQFLEPDTLIGGLTPTVFSPALIPGQFLEPDTLTGGLSPIVPSPALIRGQLINPDTLTGGLSPTVFDPELAHGQPIYPDELDPALSITVYEPALANTQQLVVGDPYVNPEPTVFDPALAQRQPSVIVVGEANQITRSVLREAR